MNLMWKKRHCSYINQWNPGWTKKMYGGQLEKLFTALSPLQRSTIGVPMPGHAYWDKETIQYLEDRYPGIDVKPYLNKLYYVKSFPTNPQPLTNLPNIDTIKATFGR